MQNALLMQACICGTSKSATCRPTKAALFVNSLSKVCQLECMLADLGHLLTNTAGLLAHKVKTWSVHIYKPTSACMLPSTQFCAVTFEKYISVYTLQAEPPSAAEVAHDPRLERVIGAILSGAGDPPLPPLIHHQMPSASGIFSKNGTLLPFVFLV